MKKVKRVTDKQLYSYLARIERIKGNVSVFPNGQKYLDEKSLAQLSNIEHSVKYFSGCLGECCFSVHNMVRVCFIEETEKIVRNAIERIAEGRNTVLWRYFRDRYKTYYDTIDCYNANGEDVDPESLNDDTIIRRYYIRSGHAQVEIA